LLFIAFFSWAYIN